MKICKTDHPKLKDIFFKHFIIIGLSLLLLSTVSNAYYPPLQGVTSTITGGSSDPTISFSVFDPIKNQTITGTHTLSGGSWALSVLRADNVVYWVGKRTSLTQEFENVTGYATYDPASGAWKKGTKVYNGSAFIAIKAANGVVAWDFSSSSDQTMEFRTYDPASASWESGKFDFSPSEAPTAAVVGFLVKDGIVAWRGAINSTLKGRVGAAIYDPEVKSWKQFNVGQLSFSGSVNIVDSTITYDSSFINFSKGYEPTSKVWQSSLSTPPFAYFVASPTKDTTWLTDMSIGANSYNWDFGDGSSSSSRSTNHVFDQFYYYTVGLAVNGQNGGSDNISAQVWIEIN